MKLAALMVGYELFVGLNEIESNNYGSLLKAGSLPTIHRSLKMDSE